MDQYGRPTFDDGMNIARTFMAVKGFQNQQEEFAHREKAWNEKDLADKYFGMKVKGEDIPKDANYNPTADLAADQMVNQKWQAGQVKQIRGAEENLAKMPDDQVLNFQPKTYAEHIVAANRIKEIGSNAQNRQAIDEINKKKAGEAYQYSTQAFSEAQSKYAQGDFKGASDELVKIGMITNNPFKYKPDPDGKTGTLYFTKDGVDQQGEKLTIDQAMKVAQEHLNSHEFFTTHLQNREARKKLNEDALLNPIILAKGKEQLRAVRQLDLNTNQVSWSVYDDKGNLHGGQPISDISQLYKEGWKRYDIKSAGEALKREKMATEIVKTRAETQKINKELQGGGKPGKFRNDWWPQTAEEKEGGDPNITEARAIVVKAYDTHKDPETQRLIVNQVMPAFQKWVNENKGQMAQGPNGEQRPLNSEDLQNVFNHIAYDIIQKSKAAKTDTAKTAKTTPENIPDTMAQGHKSSIKTQTPQKEPGMIEAGNIDLNNRPVVKNADASISTELSFSIKTDKGEVLIPQIVNGKKVSRQEAIDHYKKTGEHLGIFKDVKSANAFAEKLHQRQGRRYAGIQRTPMTTN